MHALSGADALTCLARFLGHAGRITVVSIFIDSLPSLSFSLPDDVSSKIYKHMSELHEG